MLSLASELKTIRKKLGKTQKEIAEEYGIPQTTWASYEVGKASPPVKILFLLAEKGYPIKGLTSSILNDMAEDGKISKAELQKRLEIARAMAEKAPPDAPIDDEWGRKVDAAYKNQIPLLRQKVSCGPGASWESEGNIEEYLDVGTLIPRLGLGRTFAMKAQGSSMLGAGIKGGDYLLFSATEEEIFIDGIYVFALDGDVYCKRLEFDKLAKKIKIFSVRVSDLEKAELVTAIDTNDTSSVDRFRIFGRVTRCIHLIEQGE